MEDTLLTLKRILPLPHYKLTRTRNFILPICAHVAQSAERVLGKDEVGGSNPLVGSKQINFTINTITNWING